MGIEQILNQKLNEYPSVKRKIKRVYQRTMYVFSPKIKSEGNVVRVSPDDSNHEYFFGYYDKSPWDVSDRYMLCMKADDTWSDVSPKAKAQIILIDTAKDNKVTVLAETNSWNVQQSCMLQWLGPDYSNRVIYNDYRNGKYCSVILKLVFSKDGVTVEDEKVIPAPVYSVAADGKFALTLDFSRLYRLRPGYGYYNVPEETANEKLPDKPCIWRVSLLTGVVTPVLKYTDFANFEPRPEMQDAEHKVNHIMLSPDGERFMVLYRWFIGQRKYSRLVTCNVDGTDMYNLSDDDMVSHCYWKNNKQILAFENKKHGGNGYYLMKDRTKEYVRFWPGIDYDGHPSYSPDGNKVVFDRYPNRARVAAVMLSDARNREDSGVKTIARVFAPFKYDNDTRCDLHPRWNRAGDKICFDSVFEGHRGLYVVEVAENPEEKELINTTENVCIGDEIVRINSSVSDSVEYSIITPVYNSYALMNRYFDSLKRQTYKNFEVILVDDCSTDGSFEKLKEVINGLNLCITLVRTKKNSGPGNARNIGMNLAQGKWVTFVDNDDWIEETLLSEIEKVRSDTTVGCVVYDLYAKTEKNKSVMESMYSMESGNICLSDAMMYTRNHAVGKFYQLDLLRKKDIQFPNLRRCEDVAFVCQAIEACKSVYYLKKPLYYYFQRSNSLSNDSKMDHSDMVKAFEIIENKLGEEYPNVIEAKSVTDLLYGGILMMCKAHKSRNEIKEYIKSYEKKYPRWKYSPILEKVGGGKQLFLRLAEKKAIRMLKLLTFVHSLIIRG